jgi:hypothetical protein
LDNTASVATMRFASYFGLAVYGFARGFSTHIRAFYQ